MPTLDALAWKLPARQRLALMPRLQQHAVGDGSDGYILKLKMFWVPQIDVILKIMDAPHRSYGP